MYINKKRFFKLVFILIAIIFFIVIQYNYDPYNIGRDLREGVPKIEDLSTFVGRVFIVVAEYALSIIITFTVILLAGLLCFSVFFGIKSIYNWLIENPGGNSNENVFVQDLEEILNEGEVEKPEEEDPEPEEEEIGEEFVSRAELLDIE